MWNRITVLAILMGGLSWLTPARAERGDYYIHYEFTNGSYQAATSITKDDPNGDAFERPAAACGMYFEGVSDADWINLDPYSNLDTNTQGPITVWLPSPDCGAWFNVTVEPDNPNNILIGPPYGVPGTLLITHAQGYWVNADGAKLIYLCKDQQTGKEEEECELPSKGSDDLTLKE
jgi:hypothetical protein